MEYPNTKAAQPATSSAPQDAPTFNYGSTPANKAPEPEVSMLGAAQSDYQHVVTRTAENATPQDDGRKPPIIEFAPDGAGDPATSYDSQLNGFFDSKIMDASVLDQPELKEQLQTARKQLDGVLREFAVGDSASRQMFAVADGYLKAPRSPEAMEIEKGSTMEALELKWGNETKSMISTAQRVLDEIDKKVPGLADSLVESGAANNADLIIHLANLGKKHGAKFSAGTSMLDQLWSKKQ